MTLLKIDYKTENPKVIIDKVIFAPMEFPFFTRRLLLSGAAASSPR